MKGQVQRSIKVLRRSDREGIIPMEVLHYARGIVFMTQIKGAWLFSGTLGTGIFMKRLSNNRWSPPASIVMTSVGVGLQAGGQKADIVIVLNDESSVRAFESHGQLKLGGDYAISAGPLGRTVKAELGLSGKGFVGCFSYSMSQGLFVGISLEGALLISRSTDNRGFYGTRHAHLRNIVQGEVPVPSGIKAEWIATLHHVLNNLCAGRRFDDGLDDVRNNIALLSQESDEWDEPLGGRDNDDLTEARRLAMEATGTGSSSTRLARRMTNEEQAMAANGKGLLTGALDMNSNKPILANGKASSAQNGWGANEDLIGLGDYSGSAYASLERTSSRTSSSRATPPPPPPPPPKPSSSSSNHRLQTPQQSQAAPPPPPPPLSQSFSQQQATKSKNPLAYGATKLVVTKDHSVNESDPAMLAHNIIAVGRGDPVFLLDGDLAKGMEYPYSDYVTVQRLSDGQIGKVSKYCLTFYYDYGSHPN